ncbi:hypothetical protein CVPH_1533 [Abyssogena phaseoliformis symbiont OG214]|nr:hypothetical protein CVPH_1533 [Abyssogena phaseoliformis symbiont OG214]
MGVELGTNTPITNIRVGSLTLSGNNITSITDISFGNNNLRTDSTFKADLYLSTGKIVDINNMGLNDISANTNVWAITLKDNQNQALAIGGSTDDYLVFDTDTCKLFLSQNGNNLNNFKMSSGTIDIKTHHWQ